MQTQQAQQLKLKLQSSMCRCVWTTGYRSTSSAAFSTIGSPPQGTAMMCLARRRPVQPEQVYPGAEGSLLQALHALWRTNTWAADGGNPVVNSPSSAIVNICISVFFPPNLNWMMLPGGFHAACCGMTLNLTFLGLSVYSQHTLKPNLGMLTKYLVCFDSLCLVACWRFYEWWGW